MTLEEFNRLGAEEASAMIRPCLDVDRWVRAVVEARPYADVEACTVAARQAAHPLRPEEIEAALAQHPRIGERREGASAEARHSRREQAGLGDADAAVEERLAAGNAAYEERFGRVFLIRAAGRDHREILAELERRLRQDPEDELAEVGEQLEQIAALRLEGLLR